MDSPSAKILNESGIKNGWAKSFTVPSLTAVCHARGIPDLRHRLLAAGMLSLDEIAGQFGVSTNTIKIWQRRGYLTGRRIDGRREHVYHPGQSRPPDHRFRRDPWAAGDAESGSGTAGTTARTVRVSTQS